MPLIASPAIPPTIAVSTDPALDTFEAACLNGSARFSPGETEQVDLLALPAAVRSALRKWTPDQREKSPYTLIKARYLKIKKGPSPYYLLFEERSTINGTQIECFVVANNLSMKTVSHRLSYLDQDKDTDRSIEKAGGLYLLGYGYNVRIGFTGLNWIAMNITSFPDVPAREKGNLEADLEKWRDQNSKTPKQP